MKKRFVLTVCVLLIVLLCTCVFAACNNDEDGPAEFTVRFSLGDYDGGGQAIASVAKAKDSKMNLPTADDLPIWEGHTFEGWKLNGEGELLAGGTEITVTEDAKYVAQWKENVEEKEQYTVSYDLGAYQGQGKAPASVQIDKDSKMNLPTAQDLPTWEGHTFEGWKLNGQGELLAGGAEITVTADVKYVAQWKENDSQREYEEGSIYEVVSEEELRHLIGIVYTVGGRDGCAAAFNISYVRSGEGDPSGISTYGYIVFSYSDEESELGGYIYLFKTAVDAQAYYDFWVESDPGGYADGQMKVAGNRVYFAYPSGEELQNYYENTVLKAEIPAKLSETRLEFILDAVTHGGGECSGISLYVSTNYKESDDETGVTREDFSMYIEEFDSNRTNGYAFCTTAEASDPNNDQFGNYEQNIDNYGDEGSFVKKELESGYVFFRYIQKTGYVYDETDGGAIILDYIYDKNSPLQLEVPSQIETKDGRQLKVIGIERRNGHNAFDACPMTSIKLPEGLLTLDGHVFASEQLEEIYLPKSLTSLGRYGETIENCPALTTIHYAGTVYEWAALTEHVDVSRWCIYRDYTEFDSTEKYIEFDVECQGGNSLHYAKDTYLVSYDLGAYEGDGVAPLPETVSQQGVANLPTAADMPTWEGHTFTGWKLDNSDDLLDPGAEITVTEDAKYVAQWKENVEEKEQFTVSYDLGTYQGQGKAPASVKKDKDSKMNLPTAQDLPTWEGHTFEGWKLNGQGELLAGGTEITVTEDAKYVAQWKENVEEKEQYTVSYDLGTYQGQGKAPASVKKDKDSKMNLPTAQDLPTWEGHTFEGWKLNGQGELLAGGAEITVTKDAKYVAQWKENVEEKEQFTVSYDLGAYQGQGKAPASVQIDKDGRMNLPTAQDLPTWEGHTFEGWKLNGQGELLAGGAEITVTADVKYVAQWKENVEEKEQYTVSYDLGTYQGQGKAPESVKKDKDSKMNLPTAQDLPTWEGHTFEGWKLNGQGELLAGGAEITVTADVKYVAQWKDNASQRDYEEGSIYEVVSEEELRHLIAYVILMGKQDGYNANFDIIYMKAGQDDGSGVTLLGYLTIGYILEDNEIGGGIYFFNTEEDAQANRDYWVSYDPESYEAQMKVVGNRIYMGYPDGDSWYDSYENVILSTEIPETLSETRLDFMLDAATHGVDGYVDMSTAVGTNAYRFGDDTVNTWEYFVLYLESSDSNRENAYAYCTTAEENEPEIVDFERSINEYGDEGSFVNKELESGYVFLRYIEKCGFQYEITDEGAIVSRYVYDANSPKDVVIPAEIQREGKQIKMVGIGMFAFRDCTMTSITIPEGVESIQDEAFTCCENLETVYLPHSLTSLGRDIFYNNLSLKTINYAGNASEWEELTQNANVKRWCIYRGYRGKRDDIKFIEFTVKFQDGTSLQYAADKVTVTFDLGEYKGEGQAPAPLTWALGEYMDLPTADELPKWEGYVFIGWKLEGDEYSIHNNTSVKIEKDSKFIAQWAIEEYFTVSYDLGEYDGGEAGPESLNIFVGSRISLPSEDQLPRWEGHIFHGWKLEGGDPERIYYGGEWIEVFSDMKFVAQWDEN